MNLNLHYDSDPVNLGMVRIKDSMPSERVENLVKARLHEFGLKMENIVAATTDGASVMKSFGRMICCVHQLCFAHGYLLAVTDFLYARQNLLFERVEKCIRMALVEIGTSTTITNAEIKILHDLIDVLGPVKHAVVGLCRRNATLLTAERIHDFVFKTLSNCNSACSASLKSHLEVRTKDMRNACLVHLLEYLHDPYFLMENKFDIFGEYGNKNKMYTLAAALMQKLFGVPEPGPGEESQLASLASTSVCRDSSRASLKEELERAITSASIPATRPSITPNLNRRMVQKECEVFEASGIRPANLQTLYEALLTIQPTSVEAERAFSACGLFVTKLRYRLHDSTIDALCFIRNAF